MHGFLRSYADTDLQYPMDAAVVIPSILRPSIAQALKSIFAQEFNGRIHVLIGIDTPKGDLSVIEAACAERPAHVAVQLFYPGFSTSVRHGGVTATGDCGALRAILTHIANSPYVAYLDDDNWWGKFHLRTMRAAIEDVDWAYALRWYVHPESRRPICQDVWESVGPGHGMYQERFGGFVDTNCFMINKQKCPLAAGQWVIPTSGHGKGGADRSLFAHLMRNHRGRGTGRPSVFYALNKNDPLHDMRKRLIGQAYEDAGPQLSGIPEPTATAPEAAKTRIHLNGNAMPPRNMALAAAEMPAAS